MILNQVTSKFQLGKLRLTIKNLNKFRQPDPTFSSSDQYSNTKIATTNLIWTKSCLAIPKPTQETLLLLLATADLFLLTLIN
jgi:hypothetical protein